MEHIFVFALLTSLSLCQVSRASFCTKSRVCYRTGHQGCGLFDWWSCTYGEYYTCYRQECCAGWRGDHCNIPICPTPCYNGGTCIAPDKCQCLPSYSGDPYCTKLMCSGKSPCFPGTCSYPNTCSCSQGFVTDATRCLTFSNDNNVPVIQQCKLTLANIRRTDQKELFYFNYPCSVGLGKDTRWCNQELFNLAKFSMTSYYPPLPYLPPAPNYVRGFGFGIVYSDMRLTHTKYPRPVDNHRFVAWDKAYVCPGYSSDSPNVSSAHCDLEEANYKISIEHDDIFTVTFKSQNGGFRRLYDQDTGQILPNQHYRGQTTEKVIEFRFDFVAPVHCSENSSAVKCTSGQKPIYITEDITKSPISPTWDGWSDGLSGIAYYYLEIFELKPDIHNELVELEPLIPIFTFRTNKTTNVDFPTFTPLHTGMYSVLLQASDRANNSKIARRLVLYDKDSNITVTKPGMATGQAINMVTMSVGVGGMHIISAIPETGYFWQTSQNNTKTFIVLDWTNHFVNEVIENKKLLNKVLPYPTQFANLEDDGVLRSKKYVSLDDNEGSRNLHPIPNIHGMVKFEIKRIYTDDREVPKTGWTALDDLSERYEFGEVLDDGSHVRLWVKATDVMNNTLADYTEVHIDNTPPRLDTVAWKWNIENGSYTHTSRIVFLASDDGSGVHRIDFSLFVGNSTKPHDGASVLSNRDNSTDACKTNPRCNCVLNTCFLREQMVDVDNCMFLVPKEDLNNSARISIRVFNQALLFQEFNVNISRLTTLQGLEEYSGPTNIRIERKLANGVRLTWDLPKTASCYGRASIQIILVDASGTTRVINIFSEETSVDLVGLNPEQDYKVLMKLFNKETELAAMEPFKFKTAAQENYLAGGVIAGIVVGMLVIIGLLLATFVILLRRGHMAPVRRGLSAMSVRYQKSVAGFRNKRKSNVYRGNAAFSNDSVYMYGEMDFKDIQSQHLGRDDVVLQSLLTSGSFADIYLATLRTANETVVAKVLKNGYGKQEEMLMKAKINFNAIEVGSHENVLHFLGAVCSETDIGPFIIYEYCRNGPLKEYLESMKDMTLETTERLLRFGVGVARGMEYLAGRKIVHRRLAARNILLNSSFDVKISGFGPQPDQDSDGGAQEHKRERIPIKWMAPECLKSTAGATEKSDVWSFGVVLWEIFSLGASPYEKIRGRDLPAKLKTGYRLAKPELCDDKWYGVMKLTWEESPEKRPSFQTIRGELDEMFVAAPTDDYYYCQN